MQILCIAFSCFDFQFLETCHWVPQYFSLFGSNRFDVRSLNEIVHRLLIMGLKSQACNEKRTTKK